MKFAFANANKKEMKYAHFSDEQILRQSELSLALAVSGVPVCLLTAMNFDGFAMQWTRNFLFQVLVAYRNTRTSGSLAAKTTFTERNTM